ncbi:MAG: UDP-N-acetylmuramate dehydrogenase [Erysipelotrichaceae bacterium]|nr:UDP-N-acetylmuramate dehydrogenase [Erysipelotrichaceae bacterium]
MNQFIEQLETFGQVELGVRLKDMTTMRIGGKVEYVSYPRNMFALAQLIEYVKKNDIDYKIIGKGSNLLCSDEDYYGLIIRLDRTMNHWYIDGEHLIAEAGSSIIALSVFAARNGMSGLEWASGIPATVGGCVFNNAGAYKTSMSDNVYRVLILDNGNFRWLSNEECEFAYRFSVFHKRTDWIILAVEFSLIEKDENEIRQMMDERKIRRLESQPLEFPSAGSVFRNPNSHNAWFLIDQAGLRGMSYGGAQISVKHCNFIINVQEATSEDVKNLIDLVIGKVEANTGVKLTTEVEMFNWNHMKIPHPSKR